MEKFNVLLWDFNRDELEHYDVLPYLRERYEERKKRSKRIKKRDADSEVSKYWKVPETLDEFKEFVKNESMYQFWSRCQYEMICHGWPMRKNDHKLDVHQQIMMNLDVIARILHDELKSGKKMDEKTKQLLYEYICSALPFGLMAQYYGQEEEMDMVDEIDAVYPDYEVGIGQYGIPVEDVKPILRPMSSMTDEEYEDLKGLLESFGEELNLNENTAHAEIRWLLKKHFDYMGLIEKGCALRQTKENNPYA